MKGRDMRAASAIRPAAVVVAARGPQVSILPVHQVPMAVKALRASFPVPPSGMPEAEAEAAILMEVSMAAAAAAVSAEMVERLRDELVLMALMVRARAAVVPACLTARRADVVAVASLFCVIRLILV